ncbi:hypothetical protein SKAU_G00159260 [Synaphobranchus kaupii]|uniref:Uncharacterized protein n=1 Tax=Synaphobranchus kaupii TaxID=118154 RepID=A0A9Q1IYQ5_SYNKA|nr:hypothetical protein SKAU_G00159260 [Synaphobranchus kaupii]
MQGKPARPHAVRLVGESPILQTHFTVLDSCGSETIGCTFITSRLAAHQGANYHPAVSAPGRVARRTTEAETEGEKGEGDRGRESQTHTLLLLCKLVGDPVVLQRTLGQFPPPIASWCGVTVETESAGPAVTIPNDIRDVTRSPRS